MKNQYYIDQVKKLSENTVEGSTAPRGRIYDRNHRLIVDNEPIKIIYYQKTGLNAKEEAKLAHKVAGMISVDYTNLRDRDLRKYWLVLNYDKGKKKITETELKKLDERKLSTDDIEKLKLERITAEELAVFDRNR